MADHRYGRRSLLAFAAVTIMAGALTSTPAAAGVIAVHHHGARQTLTSNPRPNGAVTGKHGSFHFRDSTKSGSGATCTYAKGRLTSVKLAGPLAAGRPYWRRGQYIPWTAKLQAKHGSGWTTVARGTGVDAKPTGPDKLTSRPPMTIASTQGFPGSGVYRVKEKLAWTANVAGGPTEGTATRIVGNYHFGYGGRDRSACKDSTPAVVPPAAQTVVGGTTATVAAGGLLTQATQANHDPMHARLVSVSEGGQPRTGGRLSAGGGFTIPTSDADVDLSIAVKYVAVDAAGRASKPMTFQIHVTENAPVATDQSEGPATPGQPFTVSAPGVLTGDTGAALAVEATSNENFDTAKDAFTMDPDGSFTITPQLTDDSDTLTFDYTVIDSHDQVSAPATVTITIGHLPPIGVNDPTTGSYSVDPGHTITGCALTNDTFYGPTTTPSAVFGTASFTATTWRFAFTTSTGCWTLHAPSNATAQTLTFTYQPMDTVIGSVATDTITVI